MERWPHNAQFYKYKNAPDNFKTTYSTSYQDVPTWDASPAYTHLHERGQSYAHDQSPLPDASSLLYKRPFQLTRYYDIEQRERELRRRFEESTLKGDEYWEPLYMYRRNYDEEPSFETPRGREQERGSAVEQNRDDSAGFIRRQYDPLVVEGPDGGPWKQEVIKVSCHKCAKPNVCMNRLGGCNHQFCDDCLSKMHGSDNPFRDTIRWHYCCELCKTWTSEARLIRIDPLGRRLGSRTSSR